MFLLQKHDSKLKLGTLRTFKMICLINHLKKYSSLFEPGDAGKAEKECIYGEFEELGPFGESKNWVVDHVEGEIHLKIKKGDIYFKIKNYSSINIEETIHSEKCLNASYPSLRLWTSVFSKSGENS